MCASAWNCAPELFNLDFDSDCPADTRHFQAMIEYIVLPPSPQKIWPCEVCSGTTAWAPSGFKSTSTRRDDNARNPWLSLSGTDTLRTCKDRRRMKALVKAKAARGLWIEDVPEPQAGINDVKIRVLATGICGTDLHIYEWNAWAQKTIPVPLVIGHEFVGEVVAVGSNVTDFHPGARVSGEGHVVCGRCRNCLAGRRHLCAHTRGVGVNRPGAFAEYIVLPMSNIWRHAAGIALEVAAIFD